MDLETTRLLADINRILHDASSCLGDQALEQIRQFDDLPIVWAGRVGAACVEFLLHRDSELVAAIVRRFEDAMRPNGSTASDLVVTTGFLEGYWNAAERASMTSLAASMLSEESRAYLRAWVVFMGGDPVDLAAAAQSNPS